MRYTTTKLFSGTIGTGNAPKIGQWIVNDFGQRGQYLGLTRAGAIVVRYQQTDAAKFSKRDALNNGTLRAFAKNYGAK